MKNIVKNLKILNLFALICICSLSVQIEYKKIYSATVKRGSFISVMRGFRNT